MSAESACIRCLAGGQRHVKAPRRSAQLAELLRTMNGQRPRVRESWMRRRNERDFLVQLPRIHVEARKTLGDLGTAVAPMPPSVPEVAGVQSLAVALGDPPSTYHEDVDVPAVPNSPPNPEAAPRAKRRYEELPGYTAADLKNMELREPSWAVPGVIPEGLTILGGKPKVGKSWLVLDLCLAIAGGKDALGTLPARSGRAIYLALEDNPRRMQGRIGQCLQSPEQADQPWSEFLMLFHTWPRLDHDGLAAIAELLEDNQDTRLLVIDTFAKVRPLRRGNNEHSYQADYAEIAELKKLADLFHTAIIVVHHLRKASAADVVDTLSGTSGIAGAADAIIVIAHTGSSDTRALHLTGRDVEEQTFTLQRREDSPTWELSTQNDALYGSPERRAIAKALREHPDGLAPKDIAQALGHDDGGNKVRQLLKKMLRDGHVWKKEDGRYLLRA